MKPAWDKLMKNWNKGDRAKSSLVADVDCTEAGKSICEEVGVKGFPTIKWGDPASLEDYDGGRDYDSLKKFAKENLKPMCSPSNIDLCDEDKKKEIAELQAMPVADLEAKVDAAKKEIADIESTFEVDVKKLQETYGKLQEDKDSKIAEIKKSGLALMGAVLGSAKAAKKEEL